MNPNCWTVIVRDGFAKPDRWTFHTKREARTFAHQMRVTGYREISTIRRYDPAFSRRAAEPGFGAAEVREALRLVREARTLLRKAGAKQAYKRVASVVHSVEGAARHAELVESRAEREGDPDSCNCHGVSLNRCPWED